MIALRDIHFRHTPGIPLLEGVSLSLHQGDFILLSGPSGCGKSTLLRMMVKLEIPDAGTLSLDETPFPDISPPALRRRICLLQQVPVMTDSTIRESLLLPFRFRSAGGAHPPDDRRMAAMLAELLLDSLPLDASARKLSVGEKQRVALLRALIMKPRYLLLDEPASALDPESRRAIEERLLRCNREEGIGILMVTHGEFDAETAAARRLRFRSGALEEEG